MSGKKRKRDPGYRAPGRAAEPEPQAGSERPRGGGPLGFLFRGTPGSSPYPTFTSSVSRGFLAVFSQPAIIVPILVLVLAARIGFTALGLPPRASYLAATFALPPVSSSFDTQFATIIFGPSTGLLVAPVFLLFRSLLVAAFTGMVVESLRTGRVTGAGVRAGLRGFPTVLGISIVGLGALFIGSFLVALTGLGFLGLFVLLVAVLFFLGYAPVIAVSEGGGLGRVARRAARSARIPASNNLFLAIAYVLVSLLMIIVIIPSGQNVDANPGILTWAGALLANAVHMGFLGVYCYRYLVAAPEISDPAPTRRAGRAR